MEPREDKAIKAVEAAIAEVGDLILEDVRNDERTGLTRGKIKALNFLHDAKNELLMTYAVGLCCAKKPEGQENGEG